MTRKLGLQALLLLLGLGLLSAGVYAQSSTVGSISGKVEDPQGASIPNAEVTIKEETTGQSRTVRTNDDGFYSAPSLPAGSYTVSTGPQGFKTTVNTGVELHVSERLVIDLVLQVGDVSETITITSEAAPVETRSGEVSSLITEKQVSELPLNGRNYAQLALMVPGVSPVTQSGAGGAFKTGGTGLDSGVDMSVNGNASNQNMWTVDGVNNMDVGSNRTLLVFPSIDSIQEFRVERNSFSAEFGQAQGAVINLITKGGGNEFHGTLFEFLRDDSLNANDFFLNRAGQDKGQLKYNNYGGNFNGPIWKNKIFFFWSEEWRREKRGQVLTGRVPTTAEKIGDFSGILTGPLPHRPGQTCTTPGPTPTDPGCYPGNRIPTGLLSPAGLALVRIFPDPTNPTATGQNWAASPTQPVNTRQDLIRFDANITDKMNVMVRYINEKWVHGVASGNFWGDTPFPTLSSDWEQPSKSFAVKLTNTLTSTAVNEFQFSRAGNDIFINTSAQSQELYDQIAAAFPTVFPGNDATVPSLFWGPGGYNDLWHQAPWTNHEDLFIWKDDFTKVLGSHDLKFGVLFSRNVKNEPGGGGAAGTTPAAIQGCNSHTGNCIADLLVRDLPLVNYAEVDHVEVADGRWRDFEFYANDTWKLAPRVTLNLGMRYSRFPAAFANDNRITNFIPRLYDGNFRNALITADQASSVGLPRGLAKTDTMGFQPRVGLAWDVFGDGKTAIRMGFGRYVSRSNVIEDVLKLVSNPPWTTVVDNGWGGSGETTTLADCPTCRSLDTIQPGTRTSIAGVNPSAGFNALSEDFRPPDSYQWNLTVSREILKDTVLEASYIGNTAHHIWRRNVPFNDVAPGPVRLQIAQGVRNGLDMSAVANLNRRLGPNSPPVRMSESTGNSNYKAFQLWLNRRFVNRLAFQASYTWSHTVSDVALTAFTNSTSDPFDYSLDEGDADLDRRHTFVANAIYEMPSFSRWGKAASSILGGWQINGIFSFFGSTPLDVTSGVNTLGTAENTGQRPDLVPGVPIYLDTGDSTLHLNPAAFALPALGQNGNLRRGQVRGKPITTLDASISKNWRFKERFGIQFRAEAFNLFNHPNFVGFNTTLNLQGNQTQPNFGLSQNAAFGTLTATQNHREVQFGLKFSF